ncbi:MAG: CDP-diacylglycerol--glycerol-3-phosphate 3-phosphatidyltransferase [Treponema sp.]|nr:CDP-diacylglycerol--glycerol-3-phosphate 3-phosphatidyltransferase [Treponema sp.]
MKTSNKFTLARMISAPVLFVIYFFPIWGRLRDNFVVSAVSWILVVLGLIFAELTDYWDGSYARKHNEVSDFGKMFDPFADVFLHLSMFTCFVFDQYMPTLCYILIFYREFAQNFLRMVSAKQGTAIAARKGGKIKTVFYVISCFFVLAQEGLVRFGLNVFVEPYVSLELIRHVGYGLFAVCVVLAYISFFDYLKTFGSNLKKD